MIPFRPLPSSPFHHRSPGFFRRPLTTHLPLAALLLFAACNETGWPAREPVTVNDPDADSLVFWPSRAYALPGDLLTVEVRGLKTTYACAQVTALDGATTDSANFTFHSVTSSVTWPGTPECPLVQGKDTTLETTAPAAGRTLVLRTPAGAASDSLFVFSGTGVVQGFLHLPTDTLSTHNRFRFRDSTAGHPRRSLSSDSLATCEVLQAAVFTRLHGGDTLSVSYRTLLATPALPDTVLPACAGIHADTVDVVENRHGFP